MCGDVLVSGELVILPLNNKDLVNLGVLAWVSSPQLVEHKGEVVT